jgi:hypothetical protein
VSESSSRAHTSWCYGPRLTICVVNGEGLLGLKLAEPEVPQPLSYRYRQLEFCYLQKEKEKLLKRGELKLEREERLSLAVTADKSW